MHIFATLTPWLLSIPLHSADNVTPANGPAPVGRSTYFGFPSSEANPKAVDVPGSQPTDTLPESQLAHALAQCINNSPKFVRSPSPSDTSCRFTWVKLQQSTTSTAAGLVDTGSCTAWFASRDGNGFMMVTAGHCVMGSPGKYDVDTTSVNGQQYTRVCCNPDAAGNCLAGLFSVRAWTTTQGYFSRARGGNDAAVLWVEPAVVDFRGIAVPKITPALQPIYYYPSNSYLPALELYTDGYPGNSTDPATGQVKRLGCNFATGKQLWYWNVTSAILPLTVDTRQGRDVDYQVPGCPGHSGGRLLYTNSNAFAIDSRGPNACPAGRSNTTFTRLVNYPGPYGANVVALQRGVRGSVQGLQWVTPSTGESCEAACSTYGILSGIGGWRPINGGSNDSQLCAGLINMPDSVGQQWLSGTVACGLASHVPK
jgi:hypothetical protein